VDVYSAMSARGVAEGHSRFTLGKALVAGQVAVSLVLLVAAGLLGGSLRNLATADPGFTAEGVLITAVDMSRTGLESAQRGAAIATLVERLRAMPGVSSAATADITPIGPTMWNDQIVVDGFTPHDERDAVVFFNEVSDGYFATLRTPFITGRDFRSGDVAGGPRVAVIDESVARKFFGTVNATGRTLRTRIGDDLSDPFTVIGVVRESRYRSLREDNSAAVYLAASQRDERPRYVTLVARVDGTPASLIPPLKAAVRDVHPAATVTFRALDDQVAESLQRERAMAVLSGLFGAVAVALAVLGLYGVIAYTAVRRRNEIGLRIALGADRRRVLSLVLADVVRILGAGLAVGLLGAIATGQLLSGFLYGLTALEPAVLMAAAAGLAGVALCAGTLPGWRAASMDPVSALRQE
ncbi:MAG: ABC transporter permease, partial [Longimicrobiales bacterium]